MARQFDARTLLKQLAVPLLEQFFQRRGELTDLPWERIAEAGDVEQIYRAWQALPDLSRQHVQLVLQDVVELATNRALQTLAGELAAYAPDRAWEFAACRTRPNKALWFYLNCPELFERAALFARADSLSVGRFSVRRNGLPRLAIEPGANLKESLAEALRDHFWPQEMRGRHCHIEHYTRADGHEYFFAYLDDWPDARLVFDDQGQLTTKSERFAFSVVFIFDPNAGVLEVIAKGGQKAYFPLQRAFCQAAFDLEVEPVDPLRPVYCLQPILDPSFTYPVEIRDGISRVRLCRIRMLANANTHPIDAKEIVFRDTATRADYSREIHSSIKAHRMQANQVIVQQATFQLYFRKCGTARARTMTFTVALPSRCDLKSKSDENRAIGERCLRQWGMIDD